jgi:hypothetical protein
MRRLVSDFMTLDTFQATSVVVVTGYNRQYANSTILFMPVTFDHLPLANYPYNVGTFSPFSRRTVITM